ncbi:hypothetical protein DMN91_005879 [Ooceraea biroi]|uniref:Uncharacterized protein n=1 Tax=Ooceraea biroi TaxID=2015173 RepID=A0A3L8DMG2_OOCBI|nr:hypothetical protein DMN91_005879 [Ooceraea biroi]
MSRFCRNEQESKLFGFMTNAQNVGHFLLYTDLSMIYGPSVHGFTDPMEYPGNSLHMFASGHDSCEKIFLSKYRSLAYQRLHKTPKEKVEGIKIRRSRRPSYGTSSSNPSVQKTLIQILAYVQTEMCRCSVMLKPHVSSYIQGTFCKSPAQMLTENCCWCVVKATA